MISIVLVLLLILGINQVFTMTSRAVGVGAATGTITRDNRAAQATIFNDFRVMVPPAASNRPNGDAPFFAIRSEREPAFRNRADELSDLDYDTTETNSAAVDEMIRSRDLNADNVEDTLDVDETPSYAIYNSRNHRVDRIGFFARDLFTRQTGNNGTFVAPMSATEAYVWYGHLKQPDASFVIGNYQNLGPEINAPAGGRLNYGNNPNNFYATDWVLGRVVMLMREPDSSGNIYDQNGDQQQFIQRTNVAGSMSPFSVGSASADSWQIQWTRYDLAGISMTGFGDAIDMYTGPDPWWYLMTEYRFQGNPYPTKPFSSEGLARTVPVFLSGCTQFIVEFAGDFLEQASADGSWVSDDPDGVIDFVIDDRGTGDPSDDVRQTRWYGFPRDTNGDGQVLRLLNSTDVLPLRDMRSAPATFERNVTALLPIPAGNNYTTEMPQTAKYFCVWGPDTVAEPMPSMLRITLAIDDPNGRINDAMSFEYVIQLP